MITLEKLLVCTVCFKFKTFITSCIAIYVLIVANSGKIYDGYK